MKTIAVIALVVAVHLAGLAAVLVLQGCVATPPARPTQPPVMPPREPQEEPLPPVTPAPVLEPARPVDPAPARQPLQEYVVRTGDSLSSIAQRFGISTRELAELNALSDPDLIRADQVLYLPPHARERALAPRPAAAPRERAVSLPGATYEVQPGDVLSRIAVQHGTTVKALMEANQLKSDRILAGQKLVIPGAAEERPPVHEDRPAPAAPGAVTPALPPPAPVDTNAAAPAADPDQPHYIYRAVEGDTIDGIVQSWLISKSDFLAVNDLKEGDEIRPGQRLIIP